MYYIVITHSVYSDKTLRDGAKLLYGLILSMSQKNGLCYAENLYLAETLNTTTRTVQIYLQALKEKQYIYITQHRNGMRLIATQDTRVALKKIEKPLKTQAMRFNAQIKQDVKLPEWFDQKFLDDLTKMSNS